MSKATMRAYFTLSYIYSTLSYPLLFKLVSNQVLLFAPMLFQKYLAP